MVLHDSLAFKNQSGDELQLPPGPQVSSSALRERLRSRASFYLRAKEWLIEKALLFCGLFSTIAICLIFLFLFKEGIAALRMTDAAKFVSAPDKQYLYDAAADVVIDAGTVTGFTWQPVSENPKLSFLPLVWGSLMIAALAAVISTLAGIAVGVYLSELAGESMRQRVKPALELLVGIPTVVIGFIMLVVFAEPLRNLALAAGLGGVYRDTYNAWIGAVGVSLVIIPVIASLVDDALRAVPKDLRAASLALGSTRWQTTWRVVIPSAVSGVLAAVILGFGRALGETMIVLMCAGNAAQITANPFESVRTMTSTIAAEMGAAQQGSLHAQSLFLLGALLVSVTFVLNIIVEVIANRYRRRIVH